jgi:gamma-carbonic anhydrase
LIPTGPIVLPYGGVLPSFDEGVFLAPGSTIIGDVTIGPAGSVWFGAVIRGDVHRIRIGRETNIQDGCVLHVTGGKHPLTIGERVTVGHGVILHGCTIGDGAMIGMGALVMDGAVVGGGSLVGARALVPPGSKVPPGVLVLGAPAKVVRTLTEEERAGFLESAAHYVGYATRYREEAGRASEGGPPAR